MSVSVTASDVAAVQATSLCRKLPSASIRRLLEGASVRAYISRSLLFSAGESVNCLYVVAEGLVRLFVLDQDGRESTIEFVGKGQMFGEAALFACGRFPVSAEALPGARVVRIDAGCVRRHLASDAGLALQMLAAMGRWENRLVAEVAHLKARSPAQRLAALLVQMADDTSGATVVSLPYSKTLLASRIGITPESLSRAMARLAGLGVLTHGRTISIQNLDALCRFSSGRPPSSSDA